ncbi:MAG: hypothetical protein AAGF98_13910 [Cyanobacteria bacterium P01_H01_bin.153]
MVKFPHDNARCAACRTAFCHAITESYLPVRWQWWPINSRPLQAGCGIITHEQRHLSVFETWGKGAGWENDRPD